MKAEPIPMPALPDRFCIEWDASLVEEAVILRMAGHPREAAFRRFRNPIYRVSDPEERERRFRELHSDWFRRLHLGDPVEAALREQPEIVRQIRRCCAAFAASAREEGADLHHVQQPPDACVPPDRVILMRLRPATLLDPCRLQRMLRHELMHIADMLDPGFGYQPALSASEAGPAYDALVRERYRVLWDAWIDGRLLRRGWAPAGTREQRLAEFKAAFSMDGDAAEKQFGEWFDSDLQLHARLAAFALCAAPSGDPGQGSGPRTRPCPLCRFPSFDISEGSSRLPPEGMREITRDFPDWLPEHGLCLQCADLYASRAVSRSAEQSLPGIRGNST